jgi:hypothetical protein
LGIIEKVKKEMEKQENNPKETSAFADLLKQVEKERKRAKVVYSVGVGILVLSLFMFLLFSPFKIPVFSQLGDRILGREVVEVKEDEVEEEEVVKEKIEEEEVVTTPTLKTTPTPKTTPTSEPTPAPQITYNCTEEEIKEWREGLKKMKSMLAELEAQQNEYFFYCFDRITSDYPSESEEYYQTTCWNIVCVDMYPDFCAEVFEFQDGVEEFQGELGWCLSDR